MLGESALEYNADARERGLVKTEGGILIPSAVSTSVFGSACLWMYRWASLAHSQG